MTSTTRPRFSLSPSITAVRGGNGPNMVLIHGVGLNADAWYAMQPELEKSFTVTAIDMPGHGGSAALNQASTATLHDFTDVIADILESFTKPVIMVGHSMGALISLDFTIRYSDRIAAAVPLNAIYRRTAEASAAVKARAAELVLGKTSSPEATLARWFGDAPRGDLLAAQNACHSMLAGANRENYAIAYRAFAECDGPSDADLQNVAKPVLCMTGEREPNSTPQMSKALAELIPNGECHIVKDARHMMPVTHARQVNHQIIEFLSKQNLTDV